VSFNPTLTGPISRPGELNTVRAVCCISSWPRAPSTVVAGEIVGAVLDTVSEL
jgi:hypothetical protein